jgi:SAM-dependent methyltransferase
MASMQGDSPPLAPGPGAGYRPESSGWRSEYGAVLGALRRYGLQSGSLVLDFGNGTSDMTATLARAGYQAIGAGSSIMALVDARARYPSLSFAVLNPESQLAFPDGHFHAVTSTNAIEHTARAAGVLRELARVMQVGGLLVLAFPNLLSPMRPLRRFTTHPRRSRYGPESGDSTWDALGLLWRNLTLQGAISVTQRPQFRPRQADLVNAERFRMFGYGADYDAVWLCNPGDIAAELRELGLSVLELRGIPGESERSRAINNMRRLLPPALASHVLLVARKAGCVGEEA